MAPEVPQYANLAPAKPRPLNSNVAKEKVKKLVASKTPKLAPRDVKKPGIMAPSFR